MHFATDGIDLDVRPPVEDDAIDPLVRKRKNGSAADADSIKPDGSSPALLASLAEISVCY
jgi:hypothetical protein